MPRAAAAVLPVLLQGGAAAAYMSPAAEGFRSMPWNVSWYRHPLPVRGIPPGIGGTLFHGTQGRWRPQKDPNNAYWIDAYGAIHAFKFDGHGGVTYSMQYVKTAGYNKSAAADAPAPDFFDGGAGAIPRAPASGRLGGLGANMSVDTAIAYWNVSGHFISTTGMSPSNEFDPDTLVGTQYPFQWDDDLGGPNLCPTHLHQEPDGTTLHHLVTLLPKPLGPGPGYTVYQVRPRSTTREVIARIDHPNPENRPRWMHMPWVTKDYYVMLEMPCYYPENPSAMSAPYANMVWNAAAGTYVRLVDRKTGEHRTWPVSRNVDFVHNINAYQDDARNVLVIDTQDYMADKDRGLGCDQQSHYMFVHNLIHEPHKWSQTINISLPVRLEIPLDQPGATVEPKLLSETDAVRGWEFTTFWYDLLGKPYRYAYALTFADAGASVWWDQIAKLDTHTGAVTTWSRPGLFPSEPIFVPAPGAAADSAGGAEDLGWLLTTVLDSVGNTTSLMILNATDLTEVGTAGPTPLNMPMFYHSRYFADVH